MLYVLHSVLFYTPLFVALDKIWKSSERVLHFSR